MQADLLHSVRGKGGGYVLARPADEIRAGDIFARGRRYHRAGCLRGVGRHVLAGRFVLHGEVLDGARRVIEEYVDGVTLADLAHVPEISLELHDAATPSA